MSIANAVAMRAGAQNAALAHAHMLMATGGHPSYAGRFRPLADAAISGKLSPVLVAHRAENARESAMVDPY